MLRRWTAEAATGKCVLRFFLSLPWTNQSTAAAGAHSNWKLSMVRRNSKRKKILMWRVIVINTTKQLHSSQNCEKKNEMGIGFLHLPSFATPFLHCARFGFYRSIHWHHHWLLSVSIVSFLFFFFCFFNCFPFCCFSGTMSLTMAQFW